MAYLPSDVIKIDLFYLFPSKFIALQGESLRVGVFPSYTLTSTAGTLKGHQPPKSLYFGIVALYDYANLRHVITGLKGLNSD